MARNCEPEIKEHVAMRMRKRAEIRKREANDAGHPTPVASANLPYYNHIQNVRFPLSKRSYGLTYLPVDDLPYRSRSL